MERGIRHRGADPEDEQSFGAHRLATLRQATGDLCWLLDRGYGIGSATELVGNHFHLTRRQRNAVARCACSEADRDHRRAHGVPPEQLRDQELWLDGLNVLTAVETALGGGVILIGRDGCCRDVAGLYSHYHRVKETLVALRAIGRYAERCGVQKCLWWLDKPVDNSGGLKKIMEDTAADSSWPWEVELVGNPDRVLAETDQIIASSDHVILDRCKRSFNLVRHVIAAEVPSAWIVDLGLDSNTGPRCNR